MWVYRLLMVSSISAFMSLATGVQTPNGTTFYGEVTILGQSAADGTKVYASAGVHVSNVVKVRKGEYSDLVLAPAAGLPEGTTIEFFIGGPLTSPSNGDNDILPPTSTPELTSACLPIESLPGTLGVKALEESSFRPGETIKVNLTVAGPSLDPDADGLPNSVELLGTRGFFTEPTINDTDGDGLSDGIEVGRKNTNPLIRDTECDGREDAVDIFPTIDNQVIFNSIALGVGILAALVIVLYHMRWGITRGRRASIQRRKEEDRMLNPLLEQLINVCTSKYDGYITLREVMSEIDSDEATAIKCLEKLDAKYDGEYYIVKSSQRKV